MRNLAWLGLFCSGFLALVGCSKPPAPDVPAPGVPATTARDVVPLPPPLPSDIEKLQGTWTCTAAVGGKDGFGAEPSWHLTADSPDFDFLTLRITGNQLEMQLGSTDLQPATFSLDTEKQMATVESREQEAGGKAERVPQQFKYTFEGDSLKVRDLQGKRQYIFDRQTPLLCCPTELLRRAGRRGLSVKVTDEGKLSVHPRHVDRDLVDALEAREDRVVEILDKDAHLKNLIAGTWILKTPGKSDTFVFSRDGSMAQTSYADNPLDQAIVGNLVGKMRYKWSVSDRVLKVVCAGADGALAPLGAWVPVPPITSLTALVSWLASP
ncbi:MAG: hypothetical protein K2W96_13735 [Gemmataceae bacterium]|nr:hypothetical protein [Gemmataceae bacterium]